MLNLYFEHIFCINLERRPDRRAKAEAEFAKHGINVVWVVGVDGQKLDLKPMTSLDGQPVSPGDIGCANTHLNIARMAKERGIDKYFVFEDDAIFIEDFNTVLPTYIEQIPNDWQMWYMGGNHAGGFQMVTQNIAQIFKTYTTHAYAVRGKGIDGIIEVLSPQAEKVDVAIASLHRRIPSYVCRPHICFQRDSFSDILCRTVTYPHLRD